MSEPRLFGVLVTYRRPRDLERTLDALSKQDRRLDALVVVDNDPTTETERIVRASTDAGGAVRYLPMGENAGYPGGLAAGTDALMSEAADDDWIAVLDDDDPPDGDAVLGDLMRFAVAATARDARTAAVGLRGARFDRRRGLLARVPTREIGFAVPVDCIAGNAIPLYLVGALRKAGTFSAPLFFSHEELDLGLRLQAAGHALYADGTQWAARRRRNDRPDDVREERRGILEPNWRSYYSLRNAIYILRVNGRGASALRISLGRGFGKPLLNLPLAPRKAARALALNARACADAWRGKL
ncbi:MAG: glycosyltransferase family 2 protein, partial [Actinomycetota bacterium]